MPGTDGHATIDLTGEDLFEEEGRPLVVTGQGAKIRYDTEDMFSEAAMRALEVQQGCRLFRLWGLRFSRLLQGLRR